MPLDTQLFIDKINEFKLLYRQVKVIQLLAENIDPEKRLYVSAINELRNSLDHIMRSLENPENIEYEFSEAMEHLYRTGYDTCELVSMHLMTKIVEEVEGFPTEVISLVFPRYHSEIKPTILEIQIELADSRANKKFANDKNILPFSIYEERILKLSKFSKLCDLAVADLTREKSLLDIKKEKGDIEKKEEAKEKKQEKKRDRYFAFGLGVVLTILGVFIKSMYDNKMSHASNGNNPASIDSSKVKK